MTVGMRDQFDAHLDQTGSQPRLRLRVTGPDRPNLIADAATHLEQHNLLIETITFNLLLPGEHRYVMEIVARGQREEIDATRLLVDSDELLPGATDDDRTFHWPSASMLHLAMDTPDAVGLTAKVARIVGKPRETADRNVCPSGSFVHLMGVLHNSGGPGGGTAHFALRANIAAQTPEIRDEIAAHLQAWAKHNERDRDVWTCSLDRPVSTPV
ncbi:MAG: hypothetical protein HKN62_14060 [Phycisphaerales bacterium]|nr:hypothetical protein [Phycisphaerales bacterium]